MIGIFDSGVGGLSVLNEIRRLIPEESLLYFADTKNLPYGNKSESFLRARSLEISRFLYDQGAKILVIACNTATAAGVESVRENLNIPVIAVEPPIKPAVALSSSGIIGVLATELTLASQRFRTLIDRYAKDLKVIERSSNDLVPLVENCNWSDILGRTIIGKVVDEFVSQGVDAIVLGSTHFSFLKDIIIELSNGKLIPVGSAEATAQQALKIYKESGMIPVGQGQAKIFVSGDLKLFKKNLAAFSSCKAEVYQADI